MASASGSTGDGYVQVLPDNSGKLIDTTELTNNEGQTVERQRIETYTNSHEFDETGRVMRQQAEIALLDAYEATANDGVRRQGAERLCFADRRGHPGRGSWR